ncbi:hypothetical protein OCU04_004091 [Sclerotinia nivalis]|uniref:Uncharacterized protein n=1 Tax=Sclerotinia nivalis TaxID=352851 RepID=A0A9X0AT86_9HELO|nr:hypothetical protein OCU04_004091 [Sclerotinia nivalis]
MILEAFESFPFSRYSLKISIRSRTLDCSSKDFSNDAVRTRRSLAPSIACLADDGLIPELIDCRRRLLLILKGIDLSGDRKGSSELRISSCLCELKDWAGVGLKRLGDFCIVKGFLDGGIGSMMEGLDVGEPSITITRGGVGSGDDPKDPSIGESIIRFDKPIRTLYAQ